MVAGSSAMVPRVQQLQGFHLTFPTPIPLTPWVREQMWWFDSYKENIFYIIRGSFSAHSWPGHKDRKPGTKQCWAHIAGHILKEKCREFKSICNKYSNEPVTLEKIMNISHCQCPLLQVQHLSTQEKIAISCVPFIHFTTILFPFSISYLKGLTC